MSKAYERHLPLAGKSPETARVRTGPAPPARHVDSRILTQ
jgi:hypothetical protein